MTKEEFKIGQRFKKKEDEGDGPQWFYGEIKELGEDQIMVEFDDMPYTLIPVPADEWPDMRAIK